MPVKFRRPIIITCKKQNLPKGYIVTSKLKSGMVQAVFHTYIHAIKNRDIPERELSACFQLDLISNK